MSGKKGLVDRLKDAGEEKMQDMAEELISNPRFAEALGRALAGAAETKKSLNRNVRLALNLVNVPTKADYDDLVRKVVKLGDTVTKLEQRLDTVIGRLEKTTERLTREGRTGG